MTKFNPELPVQTRDGRKARIICTDRKGGSFPIMALSKNVGCESENLSHHTKCGYLYSGNRESPSDLTNIPEKRWAVLFRDNSWAAFDDEEAARQLVRINDRALASLEFTEGQGL